MTKTIVYDLENIEFEMDASNIGSVVEKRTSNNSTYKKAHKKTVSNETGKCQFCSYHGGENISQNNRRLKNKPWSNKKKYKTKYKPVNM
jgi:hypothetical protein